MADKNLFASERSAARLLDMTRSEFAKLVKAGHLPKPVEIARGVKRWKVSTLERLGSGEAARKGINEDVDI